MTVHHILSSEENKNQGSPVQKTGIFYGTTWIVCISLTVLCCDKTVHSLRQHAGWKLFLEVQSASKHKKANRQNIMINSTKLTTSLNLYHPKRQVSCLLSYFQKKKKKKVEGVQNKSNIREVQSDPLK